MRPDVGTRQLWGMRFQLAPQGPGYRVTVLVPHPEELPALAVTYIDATATRLLHAVAQREVQGSR
jgi:hypothetical protein